MLAALPLRAADLEAARKLVIGGGYAEAIAAARAGMREHGDVAEWPLLLGRALTEVGRCPEARDILAKAVGSFSTDLPLRLAFHRALLEVGAVSEAREQLGEMDRLGGSRQWAYRAPADRVALGRLALMVGGDPKRVLELFFDPVKKEAPEFREVWLANGELALDKNDFALAARSFTAAAKKFPEDPDVWF